MDGSILDGSLPNPKRKLVEAWIEIHRDDLLADWQLAVEGSTVFKIKVLELKRDTSRVKEGHFPVIEALSTNISNDIKINNLNIGNT